VSRKILIERVGEAGQVGDRKIAGEIIEEPSCQEDRKDFA
jgi:hypothetical protein